MEKLFIIIRPFPYKTVVLYLILIFAWANSGFSQREPRQLSGNYWKSWSKANYYLLNFENGTHNLYYSNNRPKASFTIKNYELQGHYIEYRRNGSRKFEIDFKDSKIHGVVKFYFPSNELHYNYRYKNDRYVSGEFYLYYPKIDSTVLNTKSVYDSVHVGFVNYFYYQDGTLQKEIPFPTGVPGQNCRYYYPTGKLEKIEHYQGFRKIGVWEYFNKDGSKYKEVHYEKGKKVKTVEF